MSEVGPLYPQQPTFKPHVRFHTIVAEIVTLDGSLVKRYEVNRHTGRFSAAE